MTPSVFQKTEARIVPRNFWKRNLLEAWVHHYDTETKEQSEEWKDSGTRMLSLLEFFFSLCIVPMSLRFHSISRSKKSEESSSKRLAIFFDVVRECASDQHQAYRNSFRRKHSRIQVAMNNVKHVCRKCVMLLEYSWTQFVDFLQSYQEQSMFSGVVTEIGFR